MKLRLLALALIAGLPSLSSVPSHAATVTRGPYLQIGTSTGVVVRWRTINATDARVRYGLSSSILKFSQSSAVVSTEHEVQLSGLDPQTRYWYAIGNADSLFAGDATYSFVTAPVVGSPHATRVWAVGDAGLAGGVQTAVRNAYESWTGARGADLWLMLGDNAYQTGTDAEFQAGCFTPFAAQLRKWVVFPTRGNHDVLRAGASNDYYEFFSLPAAAEAGGVPSSSEAYYSFDWANIHFVCLDSEGSSRAVGSPMLVWLRQDLAATGQDWIVAYWHHPPYSKGSHDSDASFETRMAEMRRNALPILDSLGVDLVLTGHSHSYERSMLLRRHYGLSGTLADSMKVDAGDGQPSGDGAYEKPSAGQAPFEGAVYVVAGSSAQTSGGTLNHPIMISSQNVAGSLVFDVEGQQLDCRFLNSAGVVTDDFTIVKGTNVGVTPSGPGKGLLISSASPNPFRDEVDLSFTIPREGRVRLAIYGADGRRVASLLERVLPGGTHHWQWNGRDAAGRHVAPGAYFAVLDLEGHKRAWRLACVR